MQLLALVVLISSASVAATLVAGVLCALNGRIDAEDVRDRPARASRTVPTLLRSGDLVSPDVLGTRLPVTAPTAPATSR